MAGIHEMFITYGGCVLPIAVRDSSGDEHGATCFHIGDGYMVTARHVVEGSRILSIGAWEPEGTIAPFYHPDGNVDLAIVPTPIRPQADRNVMHDGSYLEHASAIPLGSHLDDWLNEDAFITNDVLVMGYPPIPMTREPVLVSVVAQVVSIVDKYVGPRHPYFVLSNIPRGGFSGGPVLMWGFLLGIATESLVREGQPLEAGYMAALTVEPLLTLMGHHRIFPAGWNGDWARELEDHPPDLQWEWWEGHSYLPRSLPWWFRWRLRAYRLTSRHRFLAGIARRMAFHSRTGWRPPRSPG